MTKKVKGYKRTVRKHTAWTRLVDRVNIAIKVAGIIFFIGLAVITILR